MAVSEIDFAKGLISVINERDFKTSTTYPFNCLIFHLCRDVGVPIWHYDPLHIPTGTVDISLIRDEYNVVAPWRGHGNELQSLSETLADKVELAQGVNPTNSEPTETTMAESAHGTIREPNSSRSTPPSEALVPIARDQK